MSAGYVLAPEAALDLVQIWRYLKKQSGVAVADRVESVIRDKIVFLARTPGAGHWNENLTDEAVKFFPSLFLPYCLQARDKALASGLHPSRPSERRSPSLILDIIGVPYYNVRRTGAPYGGCNPHFERPNHHPLSGARGPRARGGGSRGIHRAWKRSIRHRRGNQFVTVAERVVSTKAKQAGID